MKLLITCLVFFGLSFLQGKIITRGRWLINVKKIKVPNHWAGHAVWGIFSVVTTAFVLFEMPTKTYISIIAIFLSALPGIYFAAIKNWNMCNIVAKEILNSLKEVNKKIDVGF